MNKRLYPGDHHIIVIFAPEDIESTVLQEEHLVKEIETLKLKEDIVYGLFGLETCPNTGRKHMQGYIQLKKKYSSTYLKKNIHPTANFENAKGTLRQQYDYITKEDTEPIEWGTAKEKIKG